MIVGGEHFVQCDHSVCCVEENCGTGWQYITHYSCSYTFEHEQSVKHNLAVFPKCALLICNASFQHSARAHD